MHVSKTEEYTVANEYNENTGETTVYNGRNRGQTRETWKEAMQILDGQNFDFSEFDSDGDSTIDALTIVHSGPGEHISIAFPFFHLMYSQCLDACLLCKELKGEDTVLQQLGSLKISTYGLMV